MISSYTKKGKKFYEVFVKIKDENGKQTAKRKRGIPSERKAREIELQYKNMILEQSARESMWTWKKWHEECLNRMQYNRKQSTIIGYDGQLKKWLPKNFIDKELSKITKADVFKILFEDVGNQVTEHTRKTLLKMVRRIFEMGVEEGILPTNPARGLSVKLPQKEQKVLTVEEVKRFLFAAQDTEHRFYPIWAFALMTGMRSGEMYALKWSDINLEADNISVTKAWNSKNGFTSTKTGETRVIPISPDLKRLLVDLKLKSNAREFVLPHLTEWTRGNQALVTRDFCDSIGVTSIKFHDLRATFITNLLAQGVPLVTVMAVVGHRKMSTTDVYLRLAGVNVKGATTKLGYNLPEKKDNVIRFAVNRK